MVDKYTVTRLIQIIRGLDRANVLNRGSEKGRTMQCPNCQRKNDPAYRFCIFCGTSLLASEVRERSKAAEGLPVDDTSLDTADSSQQNVPRRQMEVVTNYAGFRRRFLAWVIDAVILIPLFFLPGYLYVEMNDIVDAQQGASWLYFLGTIVSAIYLVGFWTWRGQTPGKIVMRIVIVKSDGRRIGIGKAILRYIGYVVLVILALILLIPVFFAFRWILEFIELRGLSMWVATSLVPILVVLIPCWLIIALDRKRQGLHDKIARTYVVRTTTIRGTSTTE